MLRCENVTKKYRGKTAVNNLSITIDPGRIYMLLGPNGSGKSTWMKMCAGLVSPTSGTIFFEDREMQIKDKADITYMPTEAYFYSYMTWKDAENYYTDFFPDFSRERFEDLMADFHLDLKEKISKMSTGMMAKGKVALALARESKLCLLDEPLNGIDIIARDQILEAVRAARNARRAFIISSHLVEELEKMSEEAIFMKNGDLYLTGKIPEITARENMSIADLYKEIYKDVEVTC